MIELERLEYLNVREVVQAFKELDKDTQKAIKSGIKKSIGAITREMQNDIESMVRISPMSGMRTGGLKNRWRHPTVKPSLRLSAGPGKAVAQIVAQGRNKYTRMFAITELAGSRSSGYTQDGQRMVRVLRERYPLVKGRGGRFVFRTFLARRTRFHDTVEAELNALAARVNMEMQRG